MGINTIGFSSNMMLRVNNVNTMSFNSSIK